MISRKRWQSIASYDPVYASQQSPQATSLGRDLMILGVSPVDDTCSDSILKTRWRSCLCESKSAELSMARHKPEKRARCKVRICVEICTPNSLPQCSEEAIALALC